MRKLYDIDADIFSCFDEETGEVLNEKKLDALNLEREQKIEGVALAIKELTADIAAYKFERDSFNEKIKRAEKQVEGYKIWLQKATEGQKFHSSKVDVSFRSSEVVDISDESLVPTEYLKWKNTSSPDKNAIKQALKAGIEVEGCSLINRQNVQVK